MPQAKLKPVTIPAPLPPLARPYVAGPEEAASPAHLLQRELARRTAARPDRWPVGRSVALIVASSAALWLAILEAAAQVVRAVA